MARHAHLNRSGVILPYKNVRRQMIEATLCGLKSQNESTAIRRYRDMKNDDAGSRMQALFQIKYICIYQQR
jgi:hypothetical protein